MAGPDEKRYGVIIKEIEIYTMEVEAASQQEAINKAYELYDSDEKIMYHHDSDGEAEAYEVNEKAPPEDEA